MIKYNEECLSGRFWLKIYKKLRVNCDFIIILVIFTVERFFAK